MKYLLGTDTCIYIINRKSASVLKKMQGTDPELVGISSLTVAELEYGMARSRFPERNRAVLLNFLAPFAILDFDRGAAAIYGDIRVSLEKRGRPIGPHDLLLAAQARSRDLVLVTNNLREFRRVDGLRVENWI
jgi:tRNA(fMet)-specific endonuclease VapC